MAAVEASNTAARVHCHPYRNDGVLTLGHHPETIAELRTAPGLLAPDVGGSVLDVRMPVGNGKDRDLVVVSRGLSGPRLVSVVMSGLSS